MEKIQMIYIAFLAIGAFGLLSSLILGEFGHGDFGHDFSADGHDGGDTDSPKIFSLRIIFAFLMAFGIGGGAMYLYDKSIGGQIIVGILSGVVTGAITYYIMKLLYSFQGNSNIDSANFIGKEATVTIETTDNGSCQIKLDTGGGDNLYIGKEKNSAFLKKYDIVKIVGQIGNVLIVEKLYELHD
jgi:membrane protein implicated in regulation of membrane protease activity